MNFKIRLITTLVAISACNTDLDPISDGRINDYNFLMKEFIDPGADYRPAPLWVWNNEVIEDDIDFSLAELKKQGIGGVYIHPRKGLITEYLSDQWFELVAYSMEKAKEMGLKVWIYDENVCPSGFAGGHYWENTRPDIYHGPDNMAMYAWHQMPGIDMLFNSLERRPDQFGNNLAVKELSSIANQFERHRTLSETYGGAGWDLRFEDMKRLGDWEYALGVNYLNQHISQLSLVGYRKQNYPQSFLNYDPYWNLYKNQTDYFARLSVALSSGRQINRTLILEPTTSVWMYYGGGTDQKLNEIGNSFKGMIQFLEDQQIEYDLGCENVIKDHGKVSGKNFIVNRRAYDLVVIPDMMENIDQASFELLRKYVSNGGRVLQIGSTPQLVDGAESEGLNELTKSENWICKTSLNEQVVKEYFLRGDFQMTPSGTGRIHHNRRQLKDGQVLFVSNFSLEQEATTTVQIKGASVEAICPQSGEVFPISYEKKGDNITFPILLSPGGSYMVYVHNKKIVAPADKPAKHAKILVSRAESKVEMLHPNVLTLDYVSLNLRGENKESMYYAQASDMIYKKFGYKTGCPWNIVQYKTVFMDENKMHRDGERFKISYFFNTVPGVNTKNMKVVVEQASFYNITLNGKEVKAGKETWLDPDFNCIDIEKYIRTGKNELKLSMNRFDNRCDPSPVYILGNFSLESAEKGWNIIPAGNVTTGSWKYQGLPFYSESVKYTKAITADNSADYEIELPEWNGTVAEVLVNGKSAGIIQSQPYKKRLSWKPVIMKYRWWCMAA